MRKAGEGFALEPRLVAAGMKAVPVARKTFALRLEFRPARLAVQGILLFFIPAGVVVDDDIRINLHLVLMSLGDQRFEFLSIAEVSFHSALLVIIAKIEIVIRVVAHGGYTCCF